jgi:integrase
MARVWTFQRKNRSGWFVAWYEGGKQRTKKLPNKAVANNYRKHIERELDDGFCIIGNPTLWDDLVSRYLTFKKDVKGLTTESIRSIKITLSHFRKLHGPVLSTKIDQRLVNEFIAHRRKAAVKPTVNKEVRNLRAFVRWAVKNRYAGTSAARIEWHMQKEPKRLVKALNKTELNNLLIAAKAYQRYGDAWYIRVLLAVSCGIRRGDIEKLCFSDIDFESETASTFSQKTGKGMASRPLHPVAVSELLKYRETIPVGQDKLFPDHFTSGKWERIRNRARLPGFRFHWLRKTYSSFIQQAGFSTAVAQDLLEHSSPKLTREVYTDVSPVFREAVSSIPLRDVIPE